jgi:predicted O-methyltransferase YrrM
MKLTLPGAVIVIDNVVRDGAVLAEDSADARVQGVRSVIAEIAADGRLDATTLQTVGLKG